MFCSHLLRQFYEKDDKMKATKVPQWQRHRPIGSPHKETVQHIDVLQNPKRYITISKVKVTIYILSLEISQYYDLGRNDWYLGHADEDDEHVKS